MDFIYDIYTILKSIEFIELSRIKLFIFGMLVEKI